MPTEPDTLQDAGRLLVVDDNEMNRDMLSRRLARRGHDVVTAEDGAAALQHIETQSFDMVLLDIEMPGMDGFEVLGKVRQTFDPSELPVVMATARQDSSDIVQALKAGANDYVTKPLDFPVVLARVQTQLALKRSKDALRTAHARMKRDLDAAARVQQALLPVKAPDSDGYCFAWQYRPCDELAGDSLNVFVIDDRHIGLYVLDVSGHGVPAALLSVTATHRLGRGGELCRINDSSNAAAELPIASPADVACRLNALYQMTEHGNRYFTIVYGVLDTMDHRFCFVSAGHPGPILVRPGEPARVLETASFPIGIVPEPDYEQTVLDLEPGDRLYLYSDGLNEESNPSGEEFGRQRLSAALEHGQGLDLHESLDGVVSEIIAWRGDECFKDDVSILGLERAASG